MAEPSGYAFVLKGGKDYSLPKAKLEEHENTFTTVDTHNPQITQRFFDRIYSPEPLWLRGKDLQDKYLNVIYHSLPPLSPIPPMFNSLLHQRLDRLRRTGSV
ncbi:hypothetical protein [Sedimentisphaera salicampi]|uniref:hypothetical protein n=1 Tax=Sedimentisphaera salicampi TaxID=1941349 RepID=UPI000B9BFFFE|nr:hypothetical protein [Sedimentisphaera salicampi]